VTIFVDLDGTLADFDRHYLSLGIGALPPKWRHPDNAQDIDWAAVDACEFYATMPPMADHMTLWDYVVPHGPVILTGCPKVGEEHAARNKREWVARHLGPHIPVITCRSKDKWMYASHGSVLVDDWEKYRHLWEKAGGVWVTHTSAEATIAKLKELGL
jgi:hypothetical protein